MTTQQYFKVLAVDGSSCHSGAHQWSLPVDGRPGKWTPTRKVIPCASGWHLCAGELQLLYWLGPRIWVAEASGEVVHDVNHVVVAARCRLVAPTAWNDRSMHMFAADCAERVLPLFEAEHPDDKRPREAIAAARAFARGEIGKSELQVARVAAYATAGTAGHAAAWAADGAADGAAYVAAWAAVDPDTEREWQAERLAQYLKGDLK